MTCVDLMIILDSDLTDSIIATKKGSAISYEPGVLDRGYSVSG
jgi:hypothetical protein